jgi:actin-related protein
MQENAEKSLTRNAKFLKENASVTDEYTKRKIEAVNEFNEAVKVAGANEVALRKEAIRKIAQIDAERAKADKEKQIALAKEKAAKAKEISDKEKERRQKEADAFNDEIQKQGETQMANYEAEQELRRRFERGKAEIITTASLNTNDIVKNAMDKSIQNAKDNAAAEEAIEKAKAQARNQQFGAYAQLLSQGANLLGESTDAGKAAAIASTTISTYLAAQQAYASQLAIPTPDAPFRATLAAGLAIASGLKNVQSILSVQTPNGGGGGSAPSAESPRAPQFNVVGANPASSNQLRQTLGGNATPLKAYVVASDVTTQQALNRNIVKASSLG